MRDRLPCAGFLGAFGSFALLLALCPRIAFAFFLLVLNRYGNVEHPVHLAKGDEYLAWVGFALIPLIHFEAWRASELRQEGGFLHGPFVIPMPLVAGLLASMLAPIWGAALSVPYPVAGGAAAVVWYEVGTLSVTAFVVAAGQVASEKRGEKPRVLFLGLLYHVGGAPGVYAAKRSFADSKVLDELTEKPPAGFVFLVALAVIAVLTKAL